MKDVAEEELLLQEYLKHIAPIQEAKTNEFHHDEQERAQSKPTETSHSLLPQSRQTDKTSKTQNSNVSKPPQ